MATTFDFDTEEFLSALKVGSSETYRPACAACTARSKLCFAGLAYKQ
jgi:hypothetical protein